MTSGLSAPAAEEPAASREPGPTAAPARPQGSVVLRTEVLDAILSGGGEERLFQRLGLTQEDRARIARIREERMAEFKRLEAGHAKVVPDSQGSHVEIAAFPDKRGAWLTAMEWSGPIYEDTFR